MRGNELKINILLVEDDRSVAAAVSYNLQKDGCRVYVAHDGKAALEMARSHVPDLILLDWVLPDRSGPEICSSLRADPNIGHTPIIIISVKGDEIDKVMGLDHGADDYITKPLFPQEMKARIKAVLRRIRPALISREISFHDIVMDLNAHTVMRKETELTLSPVEFQILQALIEAPGIVLSRGALIKKVWGADVNVDERTVDVHITRLRHVLIKASSDGLDLIKTIRLGGYKLVPPTKATKRHNHGVSS
ncbi:MAG: response regulator [Proteobacteria bacterium]|nr:response regulator [Pseudomonadota bacterium]